MYKIVRTSRLYEQIIQQVEESVRKGVLKAGDKLPAEREMAEQLGVSRTAVREAVKALREKGLVEAYPGRGTFIMESNRYPIRLSLERVMKTGPGKGATYLAEVREMMEPEIAAMAAERADGEDVATLRESFAAMESAKRDPEAFLGADLNFHLALADAAGNPIILSLIHSILGLLREQRMGIFHVESSGERGQYHHKRILQAVEHRDSAEAREAMKEHMRQVREDSQKAPSGHD